MLSAAVLHNMTMPSTSGTFRNSQSSVSNDATWSDRSELSSSQPINCVSSASHVDDTQANTDDELSLSQYELDIVNKYLTELGDSDEHSGRNELDDQLPIAQDHSNDRSEPIESESLSQSLSLSHAASTSQQPEPNANANAHATDEIRCTQTSRPFEFDQANQSSAMINHRITEPAPIDTHNDVNNNNIRLSSDIDSHRISPPTYSRHCDNNRRTNTNPLSTRINANLPIMVGITSCIWGLFIYAVKSFYSDLTWLHYSTLSIQCSLTEPHGARTNNFESKLSRNQFTIPSRFKYHQCGSTLFRAVEHGISQYLFCFRRFVIVCSIFSQIVF